MNTFSFWLVAAHWHPHSRWQPVVKCVEDALHPGPHLIVPPGRRTAIVFLGAARVPPNQRAKTLPDLKIAGTSCMHSNKSSTMTVSRLGNITGMLFNTSLGAQSWKCIYFGLKDVTAGTATRQSCWTWRWSCRQSPCWNSLMLIQFLKDQPGSHECKLKDTSWLLQLMWSCELMTCLCLHVFFSVYIVAPWFRRFSFLETDIVRSDTDNDRDFRRPTSKIITSDELQDCCYCLNLTKLSGLHT